MLWRPCCPTKELTSSFPGETVTLQIVSTVTVAHPSLACPVYTHKHTHTHPVPGLTHIHTHTHTHTHPVPASPMCTPPPPPPTTTNTTTTNPPTQTNPKENRRGIGVAHGKNSHSAPFPLHPTGTLAWTWGAPVNKADKVLLPMALTSKGRRKNDLKESEEPSSIRKGSWRALAWAPSQAAGDGWVGLS